MVSGSKVQGVPPLAQNPLPIHCELVHWNEGRDIPLYCAVSRNRGWPSVGFLGLILPCCTWRCSLRWRRHSLLFPSLSCLPSFPKYTITGSLPSPAPFPFSNSTSLQERGLARISWETDSEQKGRRRCYLVDRSEARSASRIIIVSWTEFNLAPRTISCFWATARQCSLLVRVKHMAPSQQWPQAEVCETVGVS